MSLIVHPAPRIMNAPEAKRSKWKESVDGGREWYCAASVKDHAHGQKRSHDPMGLSIRDRKRYGCSDRGSRRCRSVGGGDDGDEGVGGGLGDVLLVVGVEELRLTSYGRCGCKGVTRCW